MAISGAAPREATRRAAVLPPRIHSYSNKDPERLFRTEPALTKDIPLSRSQSYQPLLLPLQRVRSLLLQQAPIRRKRRQVKYLLVPLRLRHQTLTVRG